MSSRESWRRREHQQAHRLRLIVSGRVSVEICLQSAALDDA